jgi:hypothetical protein
MNWKQQAELEHDKRLAEAAYIESIIESQRDRFCQDALQSCLKSYAGLDVKPTSKRHTVDCVTFEGLDLGVYQAGEVTPDGVVYPVTTKWHGMAMEGVCPECGRTVLSAPILSKAQLGGLLKQFRAGNHECIDMEAGE